MIELTFPAKSPTIDGSDLPSPASPIREVVSMSKPREGKPRQEITFAQAVAELPDAEAKARADSAIYAEAYAQCVQTLHRLHRVMARERAISVSASRRVDRLRAVVDAGEGRAPNVRRRVDNPMITQGLLDAVAEGEVATPHQSSIMADINQALLVGGLAKVKSKDEFQFLAAAQYCHLYERSQIGGARATDYSQVRVDTSGPQQDVISAEQDAARAAYDRAHKSLGQRRGDIVEQVVVYGVSVRGLAKLLQLGDGGHARKRAEKELLEALDVLVDHFELKPVSTARRRRWSDGSKAVVMRDADGEVVQLRSGGLPKKAIAEQAKSV